MIIITIHISDNFYFSMVVIFPYNDVIVYIQVVWPNRGGGFGITEIVDVVNLEKIEER